MSKTCWCVLAGSVLAAASCAHRDVVCPPKGPEANAWTEEIPLHKLDHGDAVAAVTEVPQRRESATEVSTELPTADKGTKCDLHVTSVGGVDAQLLDPDQTGEHQTLRLDLARALELAGGQSPQIALAVARYREAYARWEGARSLWLPTLRAGTS